MLQSATVAAATLVAAVLTGTPSPQSSPPTLEPDVDDRLYGRVVTASGEVFEGFIRWDKNEGSWVDILDAHKELPFENLDDAERLTGREYRPRQRSVEILGLRISWSDDESSWPSSVETGIRFGHIRSIEVLDDDLARLVLKSGEEVELLGSADLGDAFRGLVVEDPVRGDVELRWRDLELIDFLPAASSPGEGMGRRLYGTLRTRDGSTWTGFVAWDMDEILTTDELDGDDDHGRDRTIPFGSIAAIERDGSRGARVVLTTGEELRLTGSNDVDSSNRGITVSDPGLGQVRVGWDAFSDVTFAEAAPEGRYQDFDGGYRLYGSVDTEDGENLTGWIRWDNDEEWSWEILNGERDGIEFDVELGRVAAIERESSGSAVVTLEDGRVLELEGSNDVDSGNKGVFVIDDDGETRAVPWSDFRGVRFSHR